MEFRPKKETIDNIEVGDFVSFERNGNREVAIITQRGLKGNYTITSLNTGAYSCVVERDDLKEVIKSIKNMYSNVRFIKSENIVIEEV